MPNGAGSSASLRRQVGGDGRGHAAAPGSSGESLGIVPVLRSRAWGYVVAGAVVLATPRARPAPERPVRSRCDRRAPLHRPLPLRAATRGGTGEIVVLPDSVHTAALAAEALGCEVGAIANSLLFDADGSPVLILTSGSHRVDTAKAAPTIGVAALSGPSRSSSASTPAR